MNTVIDSPTARVLKGGEPFRSPQGSVYAPGVSAQTAGSTTLFLGIVTLPPGERTKAHIHERHESAFYLLSGEEVELWSGPQLEQRSIARAGDYLFIPAGVAHVAVNRSATKPAVFVGARNEATASESAHMTPDLDINVP
jgi:uncharacterized RmlC-like cupin family protein